MGETQANSIASVTAVFTVPRRGNPGTINGRPAASVLQWLAEFRALHATTSAELETLAARGLREVDVKDGSIIYTLIVSDQETVEEAERLAREFLRAASPEDLPELLTELLAMAPEQ